jgi:predicted acyl esterase
VLNEGFFHQWWGHVSIGTMQPLIYDYLSKEEVSRRVAALMQTPEVQESPYLHIQLKYPEKNPLVFDFLVQPHDGPYYWERSAYTMMDRIKIPVLLMARWSGWPIHLAGAFQAWEGLATTKKMMIMETKETSGPRRPWRDHQDIILRWYDHWLKGNDTGFMDEPPIRLLIKGKNEYRDEQEWPLARTKWTKMYLGPNGTLSLSRAVTEGSGSFKNDPDLPPNQHAPGITFTSAPFDVPTEMTGPVALYVHARLDQTDATWIVTVRDVAPDGTSRTVTKGWLRASQRELDVEKSRPYQPYQKHARRETLEPGQSYEFAVEIRETSNVFLPGHRIALDIKGQDTTAEDPIWVHTCNAIPTTHTVQFGGKFDSYLLLPVIPG